MKKVLGWVVFCLVVVSSPATAVEFSIFGDTTMRKSDNSKQFDLGGVNLTAEHNVSDSSYITAEILFNFMGHGYESNVTRFSITHKISDHTEIYAGKFVKGLGLWHQTFHHGSLALDTISLPFFIGGENEHHSFVAAHIVGAGISSGIGGFSYQLALGNQPLINTANIESNRLRILQIDRESPADSFSSFVKLNYAINDQTEISIFGNARGVMEGDETNPVGANSGVTPGQELFEQQQVGLNFLYAGDKFSCFIEYYVLSTEDSHALNITAPTPLTFNPVRYEADMYYVQIGWRFSDVFSASVRRESLDYEENSTFFQALALEKQTRSVLGMNYRFAESNALRFEASKIQLDETQALKKEETIFGLQWFFLLL